MLWCFMGKTFSIGCHLRKFVHSVRGVTVEESGSEGRWGWGAEKNRGEGRRRGWMNDAVR